MLGKFKDNIQNTGVTKCSMLKVAFDFCCTRVILSTLIHILAIVFELFGTVRNSFVLI